MHVGEDHGWGSTLAHDEVDHDAGPGLVYVVVAYEVEPVYAHDEENDVEEQDVGGPDFGEHDVGEPKMVHDVEQGLAHDVELGLAHDVELGLAHDVDLGLAHDAKQYVVQEMDQLLVDHGVELMSEIFWWFHLFAAGLRYRARVLRTPSAVATA